jgi:hypothetical protein
MEKLYQLIAELEHSISYFEKRNEVVSQSTVGWQIEHSLKVISQITDTLEKSNPSNYKWKFNFMRMVVMGMNKIPRGKGKAPKQVIPEGEVTIASLKQSVEKTKVNVQKLNTLQTNHFFNHPYFGNLNLKPAKIFIGIHTQHHLEIIKDIIKTN